VSTQRHSRDASTPSAEYWLYADKGKARVLRKKREKLARLANPLVAKYNELVEETGLDDSYGFFEIRPGRNLIP
jgi:hypothetical protein